MTRLGKLVHLDDFYPMFIWNLLLYQFNQKVYFAGKRLFDQIVFAIISDVKQSFKTKVLVLFKLTSEKRNKSGVGPLACVHLEKYHPVSVGSRQNQVRFCLGKFLKEDQISPRQASLRNQASSPPFVLSSP